MTYGEYKCKVKIGAEGSCGFVAESLSDAIDIVESDPEYCLYGTISNRDTRTGILEVKCELVESY